MCAAYPCVTPERATKHDVVLAATVGGVVLGLVVLVSYWLYVAIDGMLRTL